MAGVISASAAAVLATSFVRRERPLFMGPYLPAEYSIAVEATACFGPCPVYKMTVDPTGMAILETTGFSKDGSFQEPVEIQHFYQVSYGRHVDLIRTIERGGFSRLGADYSQNVTDMPSRTIRVSSPRGQSATHVYAVPCERDARAGLSPESLSSKTVPDVFCDVEARLERIACDAYAHGRSEPHPMIEPFYPPVCDER